MRTRHILLCVIYVTGIYITVLHYLVAVIDDLIPNSATTSHKHTPVHPLIPLITRLHRHMESHPVLIGTDFLLPKTLDDLPPPRPGARCLQIDDRTVVGLQVIARVEMRSLHLGAGGGIG